MVVSIPGHWVWRCLLDRFHVTDTFLPSPASDVPKVPALAEFGRSKWQEKARIGREEVPDERLFGSCSA